MGSGENSGYGVVAPFLLIVVVFVQITLSHFQMLSPWKGGGFGMFSTIDRPSWRLLRGYLISSDSTEFPVGQPYLGYSSDRDRRIRTMPSRALLSDVAKELTQRKWIGYDVGRVLETFRNISPEARSQLLDADVNRYMEMSDTSPGLSTILNSSDVVAFPVEREVPDSDLVTFAQVRVGVWIMQFDPAQNRVSGEKIVEVFVER